MYGNMQLRDFFSLFISWYKEYIFGKFIVQHCEYVIEA